MENIRKTPDFRLTSKRDIYFENIDRSSQLEPIIFDGGVFPRQGSVQSDFKGSLNLSPLDDGFDMPSAEELELRMKQRIEEENRKKFIQRVSTDGCVVRSLASATGIIASDTDYAMRFGQLDRQRKLVEAYILDGVGLPKNEPRSASGWLGKFINKVRQAPTDLGKALGDRKIKGGKFEPDEILNLLKEGKKVVACSDDHAVHLGLDENDDFIAISDGGTPISLYETKFTTLIFE